MLDDETFELQLEIDELEEKLIPDMVCATTCTCKCTSTSCIGWGEGSADGFETVHSKVD